MALASAGGALKEIAATPRAMPSVSSLQAMEWLKAGPQQDRGRLTERINRA
ncbi:hypothetical protein [Pantoea sp. 1.19]|uniref:hypothetical protein n=1 Tax=Pantoea sp. 1.19 TaxID=1925589 RepID=UPI001F0B6815|nr:hypothetical protein [Pantoea sp. 1.19]